MEFQQADHSIDFIVKKILSGRMALPDFQRDFVWTPSRVVELLDSVSRQWPIGSLLLLKGPQDFAFRAVSDGPVIRADDLDLYILDGQQRVTALYHAIADVSDFAYYVDFRSLLAGEDDPIRWERRSSFLENYSNLAARAKSKIALISEVWDATKFYQWLRLQRNDAERDRLLDCREKRLAGLHANVYKIFSIQLDQAIELEALARIFETLNRTGVALNAFDLMVAALYPKGFRLRDEWNKVRDNNPIIQHLAPNELELLKLVALIARIEDGRKAARGVRQGDLLAMERGLVKKYWADAAKLYVDALEFARVHFGVTAKSVVPSWNMILGVASLLHLRADNSVIGEWWCNSLLDQTYAQAANTAIVASVDSWTIGLDSGERPRVDPAAYLDIGARSSGLFARGMAALIVAAGGLDLLSGKALSESDGLALRAVDARDSVIRRVNVDDTMAQVVVVSVDSDRRLGKSMKLSDIPGVRERLRTQGIERGTRSNRFMTGLFAASARGE